MICTCLSYIRSEEKGESNEINNVCQIQYTEIPYDIQVLILAFCDIPDLYSLSLTCKWLNHVIMHNSESDEFLWGNIALNHFAGKLMHIENGQPWKNVVQLIVTNQSHWSCKSDFYYSILTLSHDRRSIILRNCINWDTIKANFMLKSNAIHYWEFVLEKIDYSDVSLILCLGIERANEKRGVLYTVPGSKILENEPSVRYIQTNEPLKFANMDIFSFELDLQNLDDKFCGTLNMFKNGNWILSVKGIQVSDSMIYVPVVYGIGHHIVKIRRGKWRNLKSPALLKVPTSISNA